MVGIEDLDRPWFGGVTPDQTRGDQSRQMAVDRGGRRKPQRLTDLTNRGRIASLRDLLLDEGEHLHLALAQGRGDIAGLRLGLAAIGRDRAHLSATSELVF